jgi:uncharacterized repeat protein (TIGR01451 family)
MADCVSSVLEIVSMLCALLLGLGLVPDVARAAVGVPATGTSVYQEEFGNSSSSPVAIGSYTGSGTALSGNGADGASYTADPAWDGLDCDGWVMSSVTSVAADNCFTGNSHDYWDMLRAQGIALGEFQGQSASAAAGNDILGEATGSSTSADGAGDPGPGVELATRAAVIPAVNGDFYDVSADYSAWAHQPSLEYGCATGTGAAAGVNEDPDIDFYLTSGSTRLTAASGLDPCTAAGRQDLPVTTSLTTYQVAVASLLSPAVQWTGGSSMGIEEYNADGYGVNGNDGATDNIQVTNVTPTVDKEFAKSFLMDQSSTALTYTITNAASPDGSLQAKDGWSFTDKFPSGLIVNTPAHATTTCSGATVTAKAGSGVVNVAGGELNAGQGSCTVTVDVTDRNEQAGTFTNGSSNFTQVSGVKLGGSASITFYVACSGCDAPRLPAPVKLLVTASKKAVRAGQTVTYKIRVALAKKISVEKNVMVCDKLPTGLVYDGATPPPKVIGGKYCWSIAILKRGAVRRFTIRAKARANLGRTRNVVNRVHVHVGKIKSIWAFSADWAAKTPMSWLSAGGRQTFEVDRWTIRTAGCVAGVWRAIRSGRFAHGALAWTYLTAAGRSCFQQRWKILHVSLKKGSSAQQWLAAINQRLGGARVGKLTTTKRLKSLGTGTTTIAWWVPSNGWLLGRSARNRAAHWFFARS